MTEVSVRQTQLTINHQVDRAFTSSETGWQLVSGGITVATPSSLLLQCCAPVPLRNVALGKPSRSSSEFSSDFLPQRANDGVFTQPSNIFHSLANDTLPFLVIDLGLEYVIEAVALMPRLVTYGTRFEDIEIRTGLTYVLGPDFSTYTLLALFPGPSPNPVTWVTTNLTVPVLGRYITVRRMAAPGEPLEVSELMVYSRT
ncbi:uncharacterized protein LOC125177838 [Hyalella azteca]|uniref:Uncharacterized protein LOC125177838 n=1 Tax=Hyalella azteca TaxID=294128 RepID=A0A979FH89_HYAAZ|nr:uncharacterized protein LOC125177838 [Hyalella azteca]